MGAVLEAGARLGDAGKGARKGPEVTGSKGGTCGEGGDEKDFDEACAQEWGVWCGGAVSGGRESGVPRIWLDGWGVEEGGEVCGRDKEGDIWVGGDSREGGIAE